MNIKKKLIAISAILAMAVALPACSDSGKSESGEGDNTPSAVTLSPEEKEQLSKHDLTIEPYNPGSGEVQQDVVESSADNGNNQSAGNSTDDNNNNSDNNNNNNNTNNNNNNNSDNNNTNNNNNNNNNNPAGEQTASDVGNNNADLEEESGLQVITGTKTVMQAYWMDITKSQDYIFNGEYLTAQFKIKEGAANGIYPVTIEWADFSNWDAQTIKFATIDGAVVVGGEAKENSFNDNSDPQLMVTNVSGNVGDTVTVAIHIKNNPGVVANILRFGYNSDALEYVGGGEGADFNGHFS